jgi:hypothetical protein
LPRPEHSARPSEIHAIGRVVRSERNGSAPKGCGFAAMNHTTLLRETRGQKTDQQDSTLNELGLEGAPEDGGRATGD